LTRPTLYTREFIGLNLFILMVFVNLALLVLLPNYLSGIGGNSAVIGLIMGIYAFANFIIKPVMGQIISRLGRRKLIFAGTLIILAACSAYGQVEQIGPLIFVIRIMHGLGVALAIVTSLSVLGRIVPPSRLGEGFNVATLGMILPMSFAPVIGEAVIEHWGYPGFWLLLPGTAVLSLLIVLFIWRPAPDPADNAPKLVPSWLKAEVFTDPLMFGILAVNFLSFMGQASMNNLIALYAEAQHLSPSSYFLTFSIAIISLRIFFGKYFDRNIQYQIVAWSSLIWVIGALTLLIADSNLRLALAGLIMGAGFFPIYPILNALIIRRSSKQHSDNNLSLFTASADLAFLLGPTVFGLVIRYWGFSWFFLGAAGAVLLCRILWGSFGRKLFQPVAHPYDRQEPNQPV
jgi:predicted MFS family arabinose efflux permease